MANDVMAAPTVASIAGPTPVGALGPAPASEIKRAARLVRSASRPVLLVGLRGADMAPSAAVRQLLAATGLPIVETLQAAGVVSRELESHYVGRVGLFKNQPGDVVVAHADVLVTIGYDPVEYDPRLWNTTASRAGIHIDSIPAQMDNHYQPTVELRGDVASTVETLTRLIEGLELSEEFAVTVGAQRQALTEIDQVAARGAHGPAGLNPAAVVLELRANLDDDATVGPATVRKQHTRFTRLRPWAPCWAAYTTET
jgi:acetolactate synthase I/II/III large subunit